MFTNLVPNLRSQKAPFYLQGLDKEEIFVFSTRLPSSDTLSIEYTATPQILLREILEANRPRILRKRKRTFHSCRLPRHEHEIWACLRWINAIIEKVFSDV